MIALKDLLIIESVLVAGGSNPSPDLALQIVRREIAIQDRFLGARERKLIEEAEAQGRVQVAGIAPSLRKERESRLKTPLAQVQSADELLSMLGLNIEEYE